MSIAGRAWDRHWHWASWVLQGHSPVRRFFKGRVLPRASSDCRGVPRARNEPCWGVLMRRWGMGLVGRKGGVLY